MIDGYTGLLVEPGDPADLAEKMNQMIVDPALRQRLGAAGRVEFEKRFLWPDIVERSYLPLLALTPRPSQEYTPQLNETQDHDELLEEAQEFFGLSAEAIARHYSQAIDLCRRERHSQTLGERKTLSFEEAFLLQVVMDQIRPRRIVQIGVEDGRSTRRILDVKHLLGLNSSVECLDDSPDRLATLPKDVVSKVLDADSLANCGLCSGDLVYSDIRSRKVLENLVTLQQSGLGFTLALHDCAVGICNPRMSFDQPEVETISSWTGVWERHVLAKAFGVADPRSSALDDLTWNDLRLKIFSTPHGLAIVTSLERPFRGAPRSAERTSPA